MCNKENKYRFFQRSRRVLIAIIAISIAVSFLVENKLWNIIDNFIFFLFGVHILFFLTHWVEDSVRIMENYLSNKPDWYKKGMAIKKNLLFTKIFFIVVAVLSILWFFLNFI